MLQNNLWYPYAQMKTMKTPHTVTKAEGVYIHTQDKALIDSISSWWSVIHGYSHPALNKAAHEQIDQFAHIMLGGLNHQPANKLAKKLSDLLPQDLDYVFFSDSGSVAVEVALKMAIQYYNNLGFSKKTEIIALKEAYHGDTFKTMAIGDDEDYHLAFPDKNGVYHTDITIEALEEIVKNHYKTVAAIIVEPLLQGAAGMKIHDVSFLKKARHLCDQYDILLIFDEVATGFGRTGHMFVSNQVCPDIVVLGKALTGGYIGHAATISNKRVYEAFYSDDASKALMHGPTFMGNPLACAIALKSIEIFIEENYMTKIENIHRILKRELDGFQSSFIKDIRLIGACACIEVFDNAVFDGFSDFAYERGIWNRTFLNYMYTMPPYIIKEDELIKITDTFKEWFKQLEVKS